MVLLIFRECQPRIVLSLFLLFCKYETRVPIKLFLLKKKEYVFLNMANVKHIIANTANSSNGCVHKKKFTSQHYLNGILIAL